MARRLARTVHLALDNGEIVTYLAGQSPAPQYADLITNPAAWEPDEPSDTPTAETRTGGAGEALLEALLGDDDTVAGWLAGSNVDQVLAAVNALPEDYVDAATPILARLEQAGRARKTLLDALGCPPVD